MLYGLDKSNRKVLAEPNLNAICPQCGCKLVSKCGMINVWHWAHDRYADCDNWSEPETVWHCEWKNNFPPEQTEVIIEKQNIFHRADAITKSGVVIEFQNSSISPLDIRAREKFYNKMIWIVNGNHFFTNLEFYGIDTSIIKLSFKSIHWHSPYDSKYIAIKLTDLNVSNKQNLLTLLSNDKYEYLSDYDVYHLRPKYDYERFLPDDLLNELRRSIYEIEEIQKQGKADFRFRWKNLRKTWNNAKQPLLIDFNNGYLFYIKRLYDSGIGFGKFVKKTDVIRKYAR